ncbi:MAG TPA: MFS transporter [Pseudonocardiaceae bacterium]|nr:MFS transporter [Pseudonocardiaceae bacterium]
MVLFVAGGFGAAMGVAGSNVVVATFAQNYVPQRLLGRLIACSSFLGYGAIPIGALVGGALADALGPRGGMWVMTALVPLSGLFLLLSPVRSVRDLPSPPEPEPQTEPENEAEPQPG